MKCLAIDTAAQFCAAAVFDTADNTILAETTRDIGRGHAEILMEVVGETLAVAELTYAEIGRVAAIAGPGSFTGIRVGLATARGIGLGLGIPVFGVSSLEAASAVALSMQPRNEADIFVALDARRNEAFCQYFGASKQISRDPFASAYEDVASMLGAVASPSLCLCGSGAVRLNELSGGRYRILHDLDAAPIATIAELAANLPEDRRNGDPIYLRAADAKPQTGYALPRI